MTEQTEIMFPGKSCKFVTNCVISKKTGEEKTPEGLYPDSNFLKAGSDSIQKPPVRPSPFPVLSGQDLQLPNQQLLVK